MREQRSLFNNGELRDIRHERLADLGFMIDGGESKKVREQSENKALMERAMLKNFKKKHGHMCLPKKETELGWWVKLCRQLYNNRKLTNNMRERLEATGFALDGAEAKGVRDSFAKGVRDSVQDKPAGTWDDKFKLLVEFKDQNGHTCVVQKHPQPGFWVKNQRTALNKGHLSAHRRKKLDGISFTWDAQRQGEGEDGMTSSVDDLDLGAEGTPLGAGAMSRHSSPRPQLEGMSRGPPRQSLHSHTVSVQDTQHLPQLEGDAGANTGSESSGKQKLGEGFKEEGRGKGERTFEEMLRGILPSEQIDTARVTVLLQKAKEQEIREKDVEQREQEIRRREGLLGVQQEQVQAMVKMKRERMAESMVQGAKL